MVTLSAFDTRHRVHIPVVIIVLTQHRDVTVPCHAPRRPSRNVTFQDYDFPHLRQCSVSNTMEHSRRVEGSYRSTGTSSGDSGKKRVSVAGTKPLWRTGHRSPPPLALFAVQCSLGTKSGDFSVRKVCQFNLFRGALMALTVLRVL